MQITPATNTVAGSPADTNAASSATNQLLSEQDFLNLLVAQMTSQDPLDPMTNQDLLGQMVQFNTLQSNATLTTDMGQIQSAQTLSEANALIGRQVSVQTGTSGNTVQGVVTGVDTSSGQPQIVVSGQSYNLSQVLSVTTAPAP